MYICLYYSITVIDSFYYYIDLRLINNICYILWFYTSVIIVVI